MDDTKELQQGVGESVVQMEPVTDPSEVTPALDTPVTVDAPAYSPTLEQQVKEAVVGGVILQGEAKKGFAGVVERLKKLHPGQIIQSRKKAA